MDTITALYHAAAQNPVAVFAAGLALSNAKTILHYAVLAVFKVPFLRLWLVGHPAEAKEALAVFVAEVDADIDDMTKAQAKAAAAQPAFPAEPAPPTIPAAEAPRNTA